MPIVVNRRIYMDLTVMADKVQSIEEYEKALIEFITKRATSKNRLRHHNIAVVTVHGGGAASREV